MSLRWSFIYAIGWVLLSTSFASAHEARPAYLEFKETASGQFTVLWRTPVLAGIRLVPRQNQERI